MVTDFLQKSYCILQQDMLFFIQILEVVQAMVKNLETCYIEIILEMITMM